MSLTTGSQQRKIYEDLNYVILDNGVYGAPSGSAITGQSIWSVSLDNDNGILYDQGTVDYVIFGSSANYKIPIDNNDSYTNPAIMKYLKVSSGFTLDESIYVNEIVTVVDASSTDEQLPTAEAVYEKTNITNDYIVVGTGSGIEGTSELTFNGNVMRVRPTPITNVTYLSTAAMTVEATEGSLEFLAAESGTYGATLMLTNVNETSGDRTSWGFFNKPNTDDLLFIYGTTTNINDYDYPAFSIKSDGMIELSAGTSVNEIVTVVDALSTDDQLPTALAVWNSDMWVLNSAITFINTSNAFIDLIDVDLGSYQTGYIPFEHSSGMTHSANLRIDGDEIIISYDTLIRGNLYVSGTTTSIDTENLTIYDNIITINSGETTGGVFDRFAGIKIDRGTGDPYFIVYDEDYDYLRIGYSDTELTLPGQTRRVPEMVAEVEPADGTILFYSGSTTTKQYNWNNKLYFDDAFGKLYAGKFDAKFDFTLDSKVVTGITYVVNEYSSDYELPTAKAVWNSDMWVLNSAITFITFLELSDTVNEFNVNRILFESATEVIDSEKFTYDHINNNFLVGSVIGTPAYDNYFALGSGITIGANFAYALGYGVVATGEYSHAEGRETSAISEYSHAEGYKTTADGSYSHASGYFSKASGSSSHAEGILTTASGDFGSHAEGYETLAEGYAAHAEGYGTTASGDYSHAEGNYSIASGDQSHAESNSKALGDYSHAEGENTTASGKTSHAEGYKSTAFGDFSHAEGGTGGVWVESGTTSFGDYSHAEGFSTTAFGNNSHSEGLQSTTVGDASHAEGGNTTSYGAGSHSEGGLTIAFGSTSHAEGYNTYAYGASSHAEGYYTYAGGGSFTHAEGYYTTAASDSSHAEGNKTLAHNEYSHAEGRHTTTFGRSSHAENEYNLTSGHSSHVEGFKNKTEGFAQHVSGTFNEISGYNSEFNAQEFSESGITFFWSDLIDTNVLIIGGGSAETYRTNAMSLTFRGNMKLKSGITLGVGGYVNEISDDETLADESHISLVTEWAIKDYVDNAIGGGGLGYTGLTDGTEQGQMLFWSAATEQWAHSETSEMFWDDASKEFGLGTSSPAAPLHVSKDTPTLARFQRTTLGYVDISIDGGDPQLRFVDPGAGTEWSVGVDDGDSDKFKIAPTPNIGSIGSSSGFFMQTDGNVGIGSGLTTAAGADLYVYGNLAVTDRVAGGYADSDYRISTYDGSAGNITGGFKIQNGGGSVGTGVRITQHLRTTPEIYTHFDTVLNADLTSADLIIHTTHDSSTTEKLRLRSTGVLDLVSGITLSIGVFANDLSDDNTLADESHSALVTEYAIKQYVDNASGSQTFLGLTDTISSYNDGRILFESGTEVVDFSGFTYNPGTLFTVEGSVEEGYLTTASGLYSHAEGQDTTASGDYSHAEGYETIASGTYSHAEGRDTEAQGDQSHAEGNTSIAIGPWSHTEGYYTQALDEQGHAEGSFSTSYDRVAHAEGNETHAIGRWSHSEGTNTIASGRSSHSQNYYTIAQGFAQTSIGSYNLPNGDKSITVASSVDKAEYIFIIGNGVSEPTRSNALAVDWAGNMFIDSGLTLGTTTQYVDEIVIVVDASSTDAQLPTAKAVYAIAGGAGYTGLTDGSVQGQMLFWSVATNQWSHTETDELVWNDVSKEFGIGTASNGVSSKVHIVKSSVANASYMTFDTFIIEDTEGIMEFVAADSGSYGASHYLTNVNTSTGDKYTWGMLNKATTHRLDFVYGITTDINDYGNAALTILSTGNVGINDITPLHLLEMEQIADSNGFKIRGFDDLVAESVTLNIGAAGQTQMTSSGYHHHHADSYYFDIATSGSFYVRDNSDVILFRVYESTGHVSITSGITLSAGAFVNEIVTVVDGSSTHEQLPTAKAVYDADILAIESAVTFATSAQTFLALTDTVNAYTEGRMLFETVNSVSDHQYFTFDSANASLRLGYLSDANGANSFAAGYGVHVDGDYSIAFGSVINIYGTSSFAVGSDIEINKRLSVNFGKDNVSSGDTSFLAGQKLDGQGMLQTVIGMYNEPSGDHTTTTYTSIDRDENGFIIGNGSYLGRSNAFAVSWKGNVSISSGLTLGTTTQYVDELSNDDTLADASTTALVTEYAIKQYVDNSVTNIDWIDEGTAQGQMMFWSAATSKWTYTEVSEMYWNDATKYLSVTDIKNTTSNLNISAIGGASLTLEADEDIIIQATAPGYNISMQKNSGNVFDIGGDPSSNNLIVGIGDIDSAANGTFIRITDATNVVDVFGKLDVSSGLTLENDYFVNELSNDDTLADASTTALVTEYAIKQYVDDNVSDIDWIDSGTTQGQMMFWSAATEKWTYTETSEMFWDDVNKRLGIKTNSPTYDLHVNGSFGATTKSFIIDHPSKPDMTLEHGSLEGPEHGVYHRGRLNNGTTVIELPDYWEGLVDIDTVTVNLTPIGKHQKLFVRKIDYPFIKIGTGVFNGDIDCYYTVYGARKDVEKLIVEK